MIEALYLITGNVAILYAVAYYGERATNARLRAELDAALADAPCDCEMPDCEDCAV